MSWRRLLKCLAIWALAPILLGFPGCTPTPPSGPPKPAEGGVSSSPPADVDANIRSAAAALESQEPGGLLLGDEDLHAVRVAWALFERTAPDDLKKRLASDPSATQVIALARTKTEKPDDPLAGSSLAQRELDTLPAEERTALARHAEEVIRGVAERYALAAMDQALTRQLQAEAELVVIRDDLRAILGADATLPDDPLALAPSENLQAALEALKVRQRQAAERQAELDVAEHRQLRDLVNGQVERVQRVLQSQEHLAFRSAKDTLLKKITQDRWDQQAVNRTTRIQLASDRLTRQAEAVAGWQHVKASSKWIRGPPDASLEALVFTAVREYDADVRAWVRAETKLWALGEELKQGSSSQPLLGQGDARARVLMLMADAPLENLGRQMLRFEAAEAESPVPAALQDRSKYLSEWNTAVKAELARRREGGERIDLTGDFEMKQAIDRYVTSRDTMPSDKAEGRLLAVAQVRFPRRELMPINVRRDVGDILTKAAVANWEKVERAVRRYQAASDLLALSTKAVDPKSIELHKKAYEHITAAIDAADRYQKDAEAKGAETPAATKKAILLAHVLWARGPPWTDGNPPEATPTDPDLPPDRPRTPGGPVLRSNAALDLSLAEAETTTTELERLLPKIDILPPKFATQDGRLTVNESAMAKADFDFKQAELNPKQTRLPQSQSDWTGRLQKDGKPFDYKTEVKAFKSFDPVGGGIHLGDTATLSSPVDLSSFVLVYDAERKTLILRGPADKRYVLEAVEPDVLKSLYRFATSGRNAAISIGWGLTRQTYQQAVATVTSGEGSPVLLDPYLVDTRVGQDLILADSIPWELGRPTLPNGKPISFHKEFEAADTRFRDGQSAPFVAFVDNVKPFSEYAEGVWARRIAELDGPLIIQALLKSKSTEEAKAWFRDNFTDRFIRDAMRAEKITDRKDAFDYDEEIGKFIKRKIFEASKISSEDDLSDEGRQRLKQVVETETKRLLAELRKEAQERLTTQLKLFDESRSNPRELLRDVVSAVCIASLNNAKCDAVLLELWTSLLLESKEVRSLGKKELAGLLESLLNPTTLAVLFDEATDVALADGEKEGRITLRGKMRYRYATQWLQVDERTVALGHDPTDEKNQVKTIEDMTKLANDNIAELTANFPPLARVGEYARLAAFLRWAREANKNGRLGAIDLSALAAVPGNDRERYPTADAIIRTRRETETTDQSKPTSSP